MVPSMSRFLRHPEAPAHHEIGECQGGVNHIVSEHRHACATYSPSMFRSTRCFAQTKIFYILEKGTSFLNASRVPSVNVVSLKEKRNTSSTFDVLNFCIQRTTLEWLNGEFVTFSQDTHCSDLSSLRKPKCITTHHYITMNGKHSIFTMTGRKSHCTLHYLLEIIAALQGGVRSTNTFPTSHDV